MTIEHSSTTVASAGVDPCRPFGSLALAGLSLLAQLGFLLAAFVIAPLLVPSLALSCRRLVARPPSCSRQESAII